MLKLRQSWCPNLNPLSQWTHLFRPLQFIHSSTIAIFVFMSSSLSIFFSFVLCPFFLSLSISLSLPFLVTIFHSFVLSSETCLSLSAFKFFFLNHSLLHLFVLSFIHLFVSFPSLILTLFLLLLKIFCSFLFLLLHFLLVIHTSILLPNALPLFNNF